MNFRIIRRRFSALGFAGLFSALSAPQATALETFDGALQFHGFASQGFIWTSDYNVFGSSDNGSAQLTELGLNTSWRAHSNVLFAAQGVARQAGDLKQFGTELDYLLADFGWSTAGNGRSGFRVGRIKNPIGFYSETRDVIFTRPSVLLPQSIYFDVFGLRDLFLSGDGAQVYMTWSTGNHVFDFVAGGVEPRDESSTVRGEVVGISSVPLPGELEGQPMWVGRIGYRWREGLFEAHYSQVSYNRRYEAGTDDPLGDGRVEIDYSLLSLGLNFESWSLRSEAALIDVVRTGFGGAAPSHKPLSYYIEGRYRLPRNAELFLRRDAYHYQYDDRSGTATAERFGAPFAHRFYGIDWAAGGQWEIFKDVVIAAEWHYVKGTGWLSTADNSGVTETGAKVYWNMFAAMVGWRF